MIYEIVKDMLCTKSGMVIGVILDMQNYDGFVRVTYMTRTLQEASQWLSPEMICVA